MSSSPSTPPPPDYTGAANATAAGNLAAAKQATEANRVDTFTPFGSLTYAKNPNDPNRWSSTVSLSPEQQAMLNQQNKTSLDLGNLQGAATNRVGSALSSQAPGAYDPNRDTNNAAELLNKRLEPQQARDRATLDTQLANQGIMRGSEAYSNAQDQIGRQQNDARSQAQLQGITLGQNQQAQQYSQQVQNRNMPINELNALRTGSQVTNPTFQQAPQQNATSGADLLSATTQKGQYDQGLYGSQVATANSNNTAMAGLAGTAAMMAMMF